MSKSKGKDQVKKQEVTNEVEVKRSWLNAYVAPRSSAAKICTEQLLHGATVQQMISVCKGYNERTKAGHWGEKLSDITSHLRWLKAKGYNISEKDDNFKLSA